MSGVIGVPGTGGGPGPDAIEAKTANADATAITGVNDATHAFGGIGGTDPIFRQHAGVYGSSDQQGVIGMGHGTSATGVYGGTATGDGIGVRGETATGVGVQGKSIGAGLAGKFIGNVEVQGTLTANVDIILPFAGDCAEEFDVAPCAETGPGTVMVLTDSGALEPSRNAYDKKVAGIISGAGGYRPGMILDRQDSSQKRMPIALVGKVYCKVDAQYAPIEVGDLLTTSPTLGHAMRASDPSLAFGAVIGKAVRPLHSGQGLVPVLIALR